MKKIIKYILNYIRFIKLKKKNIIINPSCSVSRSTFGKFIKIYSKVEFNDSSIEDFSYINKNCTLNNVQIGKFTSIAPIQKLYMDSIL